MKTKYYVYKRNDGYVFAVTYVCRDYRTPSGYVCTYELLATFEDWKEIDRVLLALERFKRAREGR